MTLMACDLCLHANIPVNYVLCLNISVLACDCIVCGGFSVVYSIVAT